MVALDITIHSGFLPHNDVEAAIAFYRDVLGFEVRDDVGYEELRWITVGPAGQPGACSTPATLTGKSASHGARKGCFVTCSQR